MVNRKPDKVHLPKYPNDSEKGLIMEVNLEYPEKYYNVHNDYSLAPEKLEININILSCYCKSIQEKYEIKIGQVQNLIPTLRKKIYVAHYRNLKLYTDLGLKVTKVLEFNKSLWLKNAWTSIHKKGLFQTNERQCLSKNYGKPKKKCQR